VALNPAGDVSEPPALGARVRGADPWMGDGENGFDTNKSPHPTPSLLGTCWPCRCDCCGCCAGGGETAFINGGAVERAGGAGAYTVESNCSARAASLDAAGRLEGWLLVVD
jgi:hypothetical protein